MRFDDIMRNRGGVRGLLTLVVVSMCVGTLVVQQHPAVGEQRPVAYSPPSVSPFIDVPALEEHVHAAHVLP